MVQFNSHTVRGIEVDHRTRCEHYHSIRDIIAIKMKCCGEYYACKDCHDSLADHPLVVWPKHEWDQLAIICGVCRGEMSIAEYMACSNRCPNCHSEFNPNCAKHYHFYFES